MSVDTHLETFLFVFTVNSIQHIENKIKLICLLCKHFGVLHNLVLLCMFTMPHFAVFVVSFFCFVFPAFVLSYKKENPRRCSAWDSRREKGEIYAVENV